MFAGASTAKFVWGGALDRGRGAHGIEAPKAPSRDAEGVELRGAVGAENRDAEGVEGVGNASRLGNLGERRELPQRGPGRSPGRK